MLLKYMNLIIGLFLALTAAQALLYELPDKHFKACVLLGLSWLFFNVYKMQKQENENGGG